MLSEHPTVKWFQERTDAALGEPRLAELNAEWLRRLCLEAGADDSACPVGAIGSRFIRNGKVWVVSHKPVAGGLVRMVAGLMKQAGAYRPSR